MSLVLVSEFVIDFDFVRMSYDITSCYSKIYLALA